jgi:hypothetical protein
VRRVNAVVVLLVVIAVLALLRRDYVRMDIGQ